MAYSLRFFSILQEQKPELKTACLYEWDGIKYLIDSLAVSHHALAPDYANHPTLLCEMAEQYIKAERPHFIAVCFDQLDIRDMMQDMILHLTTTN